MQLEEGKIYETRDGLEQIEVERRDPPPEYPEHCWWERGGARSFTAEGRYLGSFDFKWDLVREATAKPQPQRADWYSAAEEAE